MYDNITYPLDSIYSNATGVTYTVSGAGQGDNPQSGLKLEIRRSDNQIVGGIQVNGVWFYAEMTTPEEWSGSTFKIDGIDSTGDNIFSIYLMKFLLNHNRLVIDPENRGNVIVYNKCTVGTKGTNDGPVIVFDQNGEQTGSIDVTIKWQCK